jgi:ligand-binding SRPBCC domain-containing protein
MGFYQFKREIKINATIDDIWDFISSPKNLKEITPEYMGFDITSKDLPEKMYPGMIISYLVKPLLGLKTTWVTEITHVKDKAYFVDEQRVGPYTIWHHEHFIEPIENGVLMKDIVSYKPPLGFLGSIANSLLIKKKLNEIFTYRSQAILKKYGEYNSGDDLSQNLKLI